MSPSKVEEKTQFQAVFDAINKANHVLIISHANPDGDAIGTNAALRHVLQKELGKDAVSACIDPIPEKFQFIPGAMEFVQDFELQEFDLVIAVDIAAKHLLKFHESKPALLSGTVPFINIDHHVSNENFGTLNVVLPEAAAAAEIMYDILIANGLEVTPEVATCLLAGIYYDTGGLKHTNTSKKVYQTVSKLLRHGGTLPNIVKNLFRTKSVNKLRLWGRIFEKMALTDKQVIMAAIESKDFEETGASPEDLSGIIEYLNMVPEGKFSVMLSEKEEGKIKASLRTLRDDIDVAEIAGKFGGGGHKQASGFVVPGRLEQETRWKVVDENGDATYLDFNPEQLTA